MTKEDFQVLIVGLPESGKTSFIQALDEILQNPATPEALRASGLAYDRTYLEKDKAKFRAGQKLDRTERNIQTAPPELWFEHEPSQSLGRIFLPDVSGEIYRDQWVERSWSTAYRKNLSTISGMLLFVRADVPASNTEILGELLALVQCEAKPDPWQSKKGSAQVQLVDVLQFISLNGDILRPLPVALLISAWDTVEKHEEMLPQDPPGFLAQEWPLISQYLNCNKETFLTRIYGVSALGGSDAELPQLCNIPPQDRAKIVDGEHISNDLTRPIRWLLRLDQAKSG
jgi:hypothetical protein